MSWWVGHPRLTIAPLASGRVSTPSALTAVIAGIFVAAAVVTAFVLWVNGKMRDVRARRAAGVAPIDLPGWARRWAGAAGAAGMVVGIAVLAGWGLKVEVLKSVLPGMVAMNPATAACFVLLGCALRLSGAGQRSRRRRLAAVGCASAVMVVGGAKLVETATGWTIGLDRILFHARLGPAAEQGGNEMALNTAVDFVLLGLSILVLDRSWLRPRRPAQLLALVAALVALLAVLGYAYSMTALTDLRQPIPMAVHTAVTFLVLSIGVLCARPDYGLMKLLTSDSAAGVLARRLLPATVILPALVGGLRLWGEHRGYLDVESGVSLFVLTTTIAFMGLVWWTASLLYRTEQERRTAEQALRQSQAFYHSLVETLPQKIFRKDLAGHFTFGNQRFLAEMGLPPEEFVGQTDFDFAPKELAERYRADDRRVAETGKIFDAVEEHVTPKGEKLFVHVMKTPVYDEGGKVIGTQGIFWDETEKRRAELELQETNQRLEESVRSERAAIDALKNAQSTMVQTEKLAGLGQMVAGVAHEINNPLSFVANNVAVMQRDVAAVRKLLDIYRAADDVVAQHRPDVMAEVKEISEAVDLPYTLKNLDELFARSKDGLKRIQQIVKDLRDFARLDESDLHEVDLNAGVESTVNIIRGRAKRKQVSLEVDLHPLPQVTCYPAKVNQIVMNLIANAIDACHEGCTVTVRTEAADGQVKLTVADNGSGIPPEVRDRIFDPFFTTKPLGEGTGLGLSISYGIVQDHGGKIEVESEVGKGTRFVVTLPLRPPIDRPS